jgi:hypothetical protein
LTWIISIIMLNIISFTFRITWNGRIPHNVFPMSFPGRDKLSRKWSLESEPLWR